MIKQNIKTRYLEHCRTLIRLMEVRKELAKDLEEATYGVRYFRHGNLNEIKAEMATVNNKFLNVERVLKKIVRNANDLLYEVPFDGLAQEYGLSKDEKYIIMIIFFNANLKNREDGISGKELLGLLGYKPSEFVDKCVLFQNLIKKDLITYYPERHYYPRNSHRMIIDLDFCLTRKALLGITGDENLLFTEGNDEDISERSYNGKRRDPKESILLVREPIINFDQIVLNDEQKNDIEQVIFQIGKGNKLLTEWGFDQTIKYGKGITMLFYGPPGTGKTATSEAIAQRLGKKIGIANYAQILDKWFGNAEKNVVKIFEEAQKNDCILVFDEADSLFGQRLIEGHSIDRTYNYMTNILMQEIERFDGLVILTTNREFVMDSAFERRILFKIKFEMPKPEQRAKIWRALIPTNAPLGDDVDFSELGSRFELTGGEIKNAIINAVRECSFLSAEKITMDVLIKFAEKELATKRESYKAIGFIG
ncbi:MAG: ATP-binding protein [candidate division WOR-3 bacterium]|nr:ATP-binding protein [candidate division WOR-3 bacterium]